MVAVMNHAVSFQARAYCDVLDLSKRVANSGCPGCKTFRQRQQTRISPALRLRKISPGFTLSQFLITYIRIIMKEHEDHKEHTLLMNTLLFIALIGGAYFLGVFMHL